MGLCGSSENNLTPEEREQRRVDKQKSKDIESKMENDKSKDSQVNKLLLLGAGESGKSTLFKQMIEIYGSGFNENERKSYVAIVYNNVITAMKTLITQAEREHVSFAPQNLQSKQIVEELKGDEEINETLGKHIYNLWLDPAIQSAYENRAKFQLFDSAKYFFERLSEIQKDGYIPDKQDVLRSRVRTTGIVENEFTIDQNKFKMFDVGGQRNERKKWIHCFENVTAVIFVAAVSEFDQVLYEDENTNRVVEALNLFGEICNSRWFRNTSMILFLNKRDLFEEKLKVVQLADYFQDFQDENTYENGVLFFQTQFESRNHNQDKQIYTHVTCATDTSNVAAVFNAVKDIIIRKSLTEAGLV